MNHPIEALRFVESADVYKAGVLAAVLRRRPTGVEFAYLAPYLEQAAPAIAFTLPRSAEPVLTHAPGALPAFFTGLLPEGRRLSALRTAVKTSADDELSLLLAVGGDVIGDVHVVPEGMAPQEMEPRVIVQTWNEVRFRDLFADATGSAIDRVALPGVQDKVSARMITLPVARRGDRFILKLDPPEFPHLVENERFFLDAARASGLDAAQADIVHDAEGVAGLLVRRFDRQPTETGDTRLLAQEDGCQVTGRYPADKYRLTTEEVFAALASVCRSRAVAARALFRQMVFAYLTCNGDAHAKNFSVLHDGEWRVAPIYDIPSSHPYGDHTLALSIAGQTREDVGRSGFLAMAAQIGLSSRAAQKAIDTVVERMDLWLPRLDELPFDERRVHKLRRAIEYRRDRLAHLPTARRS